MSAVIFWGTGTDAERNLNYIKRRADLFVNDKFILFVDNNSDKHGKKLNGIEIFKPEILFQVKFDHIVIMSSYYEKAIRQQIINEFKIEPDKVLSFRDYSGMRHAEKLYLDRYSRMSNEKKKKVFSDKIVVYTAIIGAYDEIKEPLYVSENIDYVCFTNNRDIQSNVWNIQCINNDSADNTRLARKMKLSPNEYFPEYETSVWIDAKFQVKKSMIEYIRKYEKMQPILCFPHYERNCIYAEAATCVHLGKDDGNTIFKQVNGYYNEGYPFNNGLFETGCMVRNHHDDKVKKIMKLWWEEIQNNSRRDQLSFPYVCWKNGFCPDINDLNINHNPWLQMYPHNIQ